MRARHLPSVVALTVATAGAIAIPHQAHAQRLDVFGTRDEASASPAAPLLKGASCVALPDTHPIELDDVILQAICAHPKARQAWAEARAKAAALGIADAAYLPRLNVSTGIERDTLSSTYDESAWGLGSVRQSQNSSSKYAMLNMSWVLFDFGKRGAARREARALLIAANASQDAALQRVLFDAARAFYALREAQATLDATLSIETITADSLAQASAKHAAGAETLADELQARTSHWRAVLERVNAQGKAQAAIGALAVTIGVPADTPLQIAPPEHDRDAGPGIRAGIDQLIAEAKLHHPSLIAARANLDAAVAKVDAARAEGRPTIALVGSLAQNNPSYQQQPLSAPLTRSRSSTIGVQVTIPLFEGFASGYRNAEAHARADARQATLDDTELQVSLEVWKSYHSVQAYSLNLDNSRKLLDDAQHSLAIARGRYRAGVGSFIDLLNAQTALADAQKQRVLAISHWRTARLELAASLGELGLWRDPR
ncbi:TolC family protein [Burkholderia sp. 22PA0099]|uniref:TolC family protein n=1 Tax=Burkholderia sp. 22PA0099 TaxID=3237372 RepID=UPI0039C49FB7